MKTEPIELQVNIERSAQDDFEYIRDFGSAPEWQEDALEVSSDPPGAADAGTRVLVKRRTPFGAQSFTVEVTSDDEQARTMRDETEDGTFAGTVVEWGVDEVDGNSRLRIRMVADVLGFAAILLRVGFARKKMLESVSHPWSQNLSRLASQMREVSSGPAPGRSDARAAMTSLALDRDERLRVGPDDGFDGDRFRAIDA